VPGTLCPQGARALAEGAPQRMRSVCATVAHTLRTSALAEVAPSTLRLLYCCDFFTAPSPLAVKKSSLLLYCYDFFTAGEGVQRRSLDLEEHIGVQALGGGSPSPSAPI
jgi:hypothetical protein